MDNPAYDATSTHATQHAKSGLWLLLAGVALLLVGAWSFQRGIALNSVGTATCSNIVQPCPVQMGTGGTPFELFALFAFMLSGVLVALGVASYRPEWAPSGAPAGRKTE
jgi:hypothetical protein